MVTAYLDESGNLADSNPFFITVVVCLKNEKIPTRIIKRLRRVLGRRKGKIGKEIKFNNSSERVKNYFIKRLLNEDIYCLVLVIDKEKKQINDGVKLADFIAGFYGQFYNSNKSLPNQLSSNVSEERLSWSLLTQKTVVPKGSDVSKKSSSRRSFIPKDRSHLDLHQPYLQDKA